MPGSRGAEGQRSAGAEVQRSAGAEVQRGAGAEGMVTRTITYTYDPLGRLTGAEYSTGESFAYAYDAVGNRTAYTATTPLSGTLVTTYTYDAARRLTTRAVSDGRTYTYTWSARGQMLAEYTHGYPVRTFAYNGAGRLTAATVFTLTTRFTYTAGLGDRVAVEVVGRGVTTYTLDLAAGGRILAEEALTGTVLYLYGHECLGEERDGQWLYYLPDAEGLVRQGVNAGGEVVSGWLFDPDGVVLEGPEGPVSHLVCGGVYDWSTGLIYRGGRYFDPTLGIWLALTPLVVVQSWRGRRGGRFSWYGVLLALIWTGTLLVACKGVPTKPLCTEMPAPIACTAMPTTGAEPPYEPERWNDGGTIQYSNNCYSYAANDPYGHEYGCKPQPGVAAGRPWSAGAVTLGEILERITCDNITGAAIADGFMPFNCDAPCPQGWYKVALVVDPYEGSNDLADYHWYRQDQGGCWSGKPGHKLVTNLDSEGAVISDPRTASRQYPEYGLNYTEFCGCFCAPQAGIRTKCPQ